VTLRLVAAGSCQPWLNAAAETYEASRPWVTTQSQVFNSALAEEVLREGGADVALLSWVRGDTGASEGQLWTESFARDGVAVIVHPDLPLEGLGLAQLREVFRGRLQEWGGVELVVVSREEGSGTRATFETVALAGESATLNAVVVPSAESMVEYVATTPGAIGYVSTGRLGDGVRVVPVEGIRPTETSIADGSYPLSRQLYLATRGEPTGEAREFSQWLLRGGVADVTGAWASGG
jgi:phosphate transport system substrate-binding protein